MPRLQRTVLVFLISLIFPVCLWAASPAEMIVISTTPIGPTPSLCQGGTAAAPTQSRAAIVIVDNPVWYTFHSPNATPSATFGAPAGPGTFITVDHATDFRAVRSGGVDARGYVVCLP